MKKKIIIFVSVFVLGSISYGASAPELPDLPQEEEIVKLSSGSEKSFWDKTLDFFGFGEKAKPEAAKEDIKPENQSAVIDDKTAALPEPTDENKNIEIHSADSVSPPIAQSPEIPKNELIPTKQVTADAIVGSSQNTIEPLSLKLPDGFEPEKDDSLPVDTPTQEVAQALQPIKKTTQQPVELEQQKNLSESAKLISSQEVSGNLPQLSDQKQSGLASNSSTETDQPKTLEVPQETEVFKVPSLEEKLKAETQASALPLSDDVTQKKNQQSPVADVSKYRKQLQQRLNQGQDLPQIPKEEIAKNDNQASPKGSYDAEPDAKKLKFVVDEAQVLTLPNDDIVLGELTEEARLDLIDFSSYVVLFWENYNILKNEPARETIDNFIKDYDSTFTHQRKPNLSKVLGEAFAAIEKNSIYDLINLLENYPILQMVDHDGNNLLHKAAFSGNYSAAKFLLMKGVNLSVANNQGYTAMDIAISQNNQNIIKLLETAGAR